MIRAMSPIDVAFDVRDDAGAGDPDVKSPTLRRYHQLLWSKQLPSGETFELVTTHARAYLHHKSEVGEFFPTSDTVVPSFSSYRRMAPIVSRVAPRTIEQFLSLNHTIGAMMVFPGDRRAGSLTINGARGFNTWIADRFDFTLEAIRRHYLSLPSPLAQTLNTYDDFFSLFVDFSGFVEFFLLEDLVSKDTKSIAFFTTFRDFGVTRPLPSSVSEYRTYLIGASAFIKARNRRIDDWARSNLL